jgi:hypothetical protein
MNVSFTIHPGWLARPDELAGRLAAADALSRPPDREPGDDDEPELPRIAAPGQIQSPPPDRSPPRTGPELLRWIDGQPNAPAVRKRAQSMGKQAGYGWQITSWKPPAVADIYADLVKKPAPAKGAK